MKNILLLGASGRTGIQALHYALSKGYYVTALVRDPEKIQVKSDRLLLIKGTPASIDDIRKATEGCEAVISTLNNPRKSDGLWSKTINPPTLMTDCMKNIVTAMKEKGIRRIVVQTAAGVGDSFINMPIIMKWLINYTNLKVVYADHNGQEQVLINSDLDWTLVRPVGLNNKEVIKELAVGRGDKHSSFISRKAVAKFIIDILETAEFVGQKPIISEKK